MERKAFRVAQLKVAEDGGDEAGTFEALVSVFGNVDRGGDRVLKGAFSDTLEQRGLPPIVWSHNWDIPPIGATSSASETDDGLLIKGRLFVRPDEDHAIARQVYAAMKAQDGNGLPTLREFSFGYEAMDSAQVEEDGEPVRELKRVDLFEVGPTLVGMNDQTAHLGVKALREYVDQVERIGKDGPTTATSNGPFIQSGTTFTDSTTGAVWTATATTQSEDNPADNPSDDGGEDLQARIGRLATAKPKH